MNSNDVQRRRRAGWFALGVAVFIGVEAIVATTRHQGVWGPVLAVVAIGCLSVGVRDLLIARRQ